MIENFKSQLFWNLFMNAPDIRDGLLKLGFTSTQHNILNIPNSHTKNQIIFYPNPADNILFIKGYEKSMDITIYDMMGKEVLLEKSTDNIDVKVLPKGVYVIKISDDVSEINKKFIKN